MSHRVGECLGHSGYVARATKLCEACEEKILKSETKPEECQSCGWKTKKLKPYKGDLLNETDGRLKRWLCRVCACTMAGQSTHYVNDDVNVQRTIAVATNMILKKLGGIERRLKRLETE